MGAVEEAIEALEHGQPVVLPTDTVYGLCASPHDEEAVRRLARLKGRDEAKPIALLAGELEQLLEWLPELRGRAEAIACALLPGPYSELRGVPSTVIDCTGPAPVVVREGAVPAARALERLRSGGSDQ